MPILFLTILRAKLSNFLTTMGSQFAKGSFKTPKPMEENLS